MVEAFLLAFLQAVLERLASPILEELKMQSKVRENLEKLSGTLLMIQAILRDAEERQYQDNAVSLWLSKLKEVAYDMNDVLDESLIEAQRRKSIKFQQVRGKLSSLSLKRKIFQHNIANSIKEITVRMDGIAKERRDLGLRAGDGERQSVGGSESSQTTALIEPSCVLGRENDTGKIVQELLVSDESGAQKIPVIPILGMAGLGKTTLAQFIYNNEAVEKHFELRLWVHVSQDFNVKRLTKAIIESIVDDEYASLDLNLLQHHLRKKLSGRRFLLVLDDVWNESQPEWKKLLIPLLDGARGSKIVVTTRSEVVANVMGTPSPYRLQGLPDDDCWTLFAQCAFHDGNPYEFCDFEGFGKEIANRCNGSPLAAKTLGCLLRCEDKNNWDTILKTEIWELQEGSSDVFRAIGLSYQLLPSHLKRCFTYCSIFPKSYKYEKEVLVQLWMAQDFIQPRGERVEDVGSRYFDSLVQRSFFQHTHFGYKERPKYMMHDLIHEFAQSVSREECYVVKRDKACTISPRARHSSVICSHFEPNVTPRSLSFRQAQTIFEPLYTSKGLYTVLLMGDYMRYVMEVPNDLSENLRRLRTLDLSNSDLKELPESIGDLKHLRYLSLCNTNINMLPESVSYLYNLQTLGLRNCYRLKKLPKETRNMINLRHLDLHLDNDSMLIERGSSSSKPMFSGGNNLRSMPEEIGNLTDLQTLSRFVISRKNGHGLKEMKQLINLRGELRISNLQYVLNAEEAVEANLMNKQHLHLLELRWSYEDGNSLDTSHERIEEEVLARLQPHNSLKELRIGGYKGALFPTWIGYSSYSNLVNLQLTNCKKCEILPPLGQLPALTDLYIKGLDSVKRVNCTFCGHGAVAFRSLKRLQFESMPSLEKWRGEDECRLTSLQELVIKDCAKLLQLTHILPVLSKLEIDRCPQLVGLPRIPSLRNLYVMARGEWIWGTWPCLTSLSSLTLTGLSVTTFPSGLRGDHTTMRRLEVSHCNELISLPDDWLPTRLTYLRIKHCPQLHNLPNGLQNLNNLEDLEIHNCEQLLSLPDGLKNLTSLEHFEISNCPQLFSLPKDGLPTALQVLSINNCPLLRQRCQKDRGQDWLKIMHIFSVWIDEELVVSTRIRPLAQVDELT